MHCSARFSTALVLSFLTGEGERNQWEPWKEEKKW